MHFLYALRKALRTLRTSALKIRMHQMRQVQTRLKNKFSRDAALILRTQQGMSLIEILIALTILGLVATFITGKVFDTLYEGRVRAARIQMQNLSQRLQEYRRHCGQYPTTEQGLESLVRKPTGGPECKRYAPNGYIEGGKIPLDPWDNEYDYQSDGKTFNIISFGADGVEGGEGQDQDIDLSKKTEFN